MKNFIITSLPRSGTKYLANNMNRSHEWTVLHEPGDNKDSTEKINRRLNKDYYGEISHWDWFKAKDLNSEKGGVIFRSPQEAWVSLANKIKRPPQLEEIQAMQMHISELIMLVRNYGYLSISFQKMTQEAAYLQRLFLHFGINDVKITKEIVDCKIHACEPIFFHINEFNKEVQSEILSLEEGMEEFLFGDFIYKRTGGKDVVR